MYGRASDVRCGNERRFPPAFDLGEGWLRAPCPRLGVEGPDRRRMVFVCAILKSLAKATACNHSASGVKTEQSRIELRLGREIPRREDRVGA